MSAVLCSVPRREVLHVRRCAGRVRRKVEKTSWLVLQRRGHVQSLRRVPAAVVASAASRVFAKAGFEYAVGRSCAALSASSPWGSIYNGDRAYDFSECFYSPSRDS